MKMLGLENLDKIIDEARCTLGLNDQKFEAVLSELDLATPFNCFKIPCLKLAKLMEAMCVPHEWTFGHYNQRDHKRWIEGRNKTFKVPLTLNRSISRGNDERAF